ncbi:Hsp90 cochaperone [Ascosphaera pollenicola]|nr:Hsp90 cochaperone [Ascosphaera pollenicola]
MDVVDLLLPGAKMLKYLGHENACNAVFGTFFVAWLIPRHVIYNKLVLSLIWFGMIVAVLVNMFCLGKPAEDIRSDEEDEEGNDEAIASEKQRESQEQEKKAAAAAAAVFATADGANAKRYALKKNGEPAHISSVVTSGSATGVMGGGHVRTIKGPRKELLGRIGCEKPTNA